MKKATLLLSCMMVVCALVGQTHWPSPTNYSGSMTVNAVLVIDGVESVSDQIEIGAFCGDVCRGAALPYETLVAGHRIYFLSIGGNTNNETITFRLWDHQFDEELPYECQTTLPFVDNQSLGSYPDWFPVQFTVPAPAGFHFITAGNWSDASNWQGGALPGIYDAVFIDADCSLETDVVAAELTVAEGVTLTLKSGKLTVTGTLTNTVETGLVIKEGVQLVNASANVSATMEKTIHAYDESNPGWYTIASPMNEMAIAGSPFLTLQYELYRFDERNTNHDEWEDYAAGDADFTTFQNGRGYLYANSNTFSPSFTGLLNHESVKYQLTRTDRPDDHLDGFNLIGNPFPHVIYKGLGGAVDHAGLASGYYTLSCSGSWMAHTFEDAIQPGQGFMVQTMENLELTIDKITAAASNETAGSSSGTARLNLSVTGDQSEDRAFVYFSQGIPLVKLENLSDQSPSLWIRDDGQDYAIAHINHSCESLDVFFRNGLDADYRLEVSANDTVFGFLQLVDNITGAVVDLLQEPVYTFHATGNEAENRFRLIFTMTTGTDEIFENKPFAFVSDGKIILSGVDENALLQLVDMAGRIISYSGIMCISTEGMAPGVYVLRLVEGGQSRIQKLVIQ